MTKVFLGHSPWLWRFSWLPTYTDPVLDFLLSLVFFIPLRTSATLDILITAAD